MVRSLYATGELDADTTLATLGAEGLKADAIASGQATGDSAIGAAHADPARQRHHDRAGRDLAECRRDSRSPGRCRGRRDACAAARAKHRKSSRAERGGGRAGRRCCRSRARNARRAFPAANTRSRRKLSTAPAPEPAAEPAAPEPQAPAVPERRTPLRFVWTMDADERFALAAPDFADAMGPRTAAVLGKPWSEIATALALDPEGRVAKAVASRDTWSGVTLAWPVEATGETDDGGIVRPADLRSRPQFPRLSRLRRLPRRRACARRASSRPRRHRPPRRKRPKPHRPSRARCSPSCRPPRTSCRSAAAPRPRSAPR